jgi:hypothetical protein
VDPEVIKQRSNSSQSTARREEFGHLLEERDGYCVFTGQPAQRCRGIHIIPHTRGSEVCFVVLALA